MCIHAVRKLGRNQKLKLKVVFIVLLIAIYDDDCSKKIFIIVLRYFYFWRNEFRFRIIFTKSAWITQKLSAVVHKQVHK